MRKHKKCFILTLLIERSIHLSISAFLCWKKGRMSAICPELYGIEIFVQAEWCQGVKLWHTLSSGCLLPLLTNIIGHKIARKIAGSQLRWVRWRATDCWRGGHHSTPPPVSPPTPPPPPVNCQLTLLFAQLLTQYMYICMSKSPIV